MNNNNRSQGSKKNLQQVKVYIRPRPLNKTESDARNNNVITQITRRELQIKNGHVERNYLFDGVFKEDDSQQEVYKAVVSPLISFIILGYNCTVFAYGQTGTGKTHTMTGGRTENTDFAQDPQLGIIPRAAEHIFNELCKLDEKTEYTVTVSFIEIYNEEVRDLLVLNNNIPLRIYEDPDNKGSVLIKGLREITVCNSREIYDWLNFGKIQRQTASTNLNRHSSRSHTLLTISVHTRQLTITGEEILKTGKLNIVDLAGSENIGRSGATDLRAFEAGTINKSLLTLGKVIKNLAQKTPHIPYRDSKLTRILQDSLGGKTKTCMIATITPANNCWDETLSTLDYAYVARSVANCPQINENRQQANILTNLKAELARLQKDLQVARTGNGFYLSSESYNEMLENLEREKSQKLESRQRQRELLTQIEKLEETEAAKLAEYENIRKSFEETKEYTKHLELEKAKTEKEVELHKRNYQIASERRFVIKQLTEQLINSFELSTKDHLITYEKYEMKCAASIRNASAAKEIQKTSLSFIHNLEESVQKYRSLGSKTLNELKSNNVNANEIIAEALKQVKESVKDLNEKIINSMNLPDENRIYENLSRLQQLDEINSVRSAIQGINKIKDDLKSKIDHHAQVLISTATCQATAEKQLLEHHEQCSNTCLEVIAQGRKQLEQQKSQWDNFMFFSPSELIAKGNAQIDVMNALFDKLEKVVPPRLTQAIQICKENFCVEQHIQKIDCLATNLSQEVQKLTTEAVEKPFDIILEKIKQNNENISNDIKSSLAENRNNTTEIQSHLTQLAHTADVIRTNLNATIDNSALIDATENTFLNLNDHLLYNSKEWKKELESKLNNVSFENRSGDTPAKPRHIIERSPLRKLVEEFNQINYDDASNKNDEGSTIVA